MMSGKFFRFGGRAGRLPAGIIAGLLAWSLIFLPGCDFTDGPSGSPAQEGEASFFAMDTWMSVRVYGPRAEKIAAEAEALVHRLDQKWSAQDPDSEISRLNQAGCMDFPEEGGRPNETLSLLARGRTFSEETDGCFDMTISPVAELWQIGRENARIPDPAELEAALSTVDFRNMEISGSAVILQNGAQIDPGGIGKGQATDRIVSLLEDYAVDSALISLGGNIYAMGLKPDGTSWRIGIQDPDAAGGGDCIGVLTASDTAVITSGDYERFSELDGVRYHHIFDPKTGRPADSRLRSVTVICPDAALGDALSTALFVMGAEEALAFQRRHDDLFQVVLITDDNQVLCSEGIRDSFTLTDRSDRFARKDDTGYRLTAAR